VEGSVVAVLRLGEPVHPCARAVSYNTTQIHGNDFVYHLGLAVSLRAEGCAHTQLNVSHPEKVVPDIPSDDRVPVTDDGGREPVQANDVVKEGAGDGGSGVGVAKRNKMRVLGEVVDHLRMMDLPPTFGRPSIKDVCPHLGRNLQRLQQSRRL